jgi:transketolase
MAFAFQPRRAIYIDIQDEIKKNGNPLEADEAGKFETFDLIYRALCAMMYNYVPMSGHPGGSISSGRFVNAIIYNTMEHDVADPDRDEADLITYAAGHKALGLYAAWALRNETARIAAPELLPKNIKYQFRLEDLLGFRRNPIVDTPLFKKFKVKSLDGHPTPATPFLRLSTGASGVGVASSMGLAYGAMDYYRDDPPVVHIIEGEGGMTPGRVGEVMAAAGTASLKNAIMHIDWNQASIDSNKVCRDGEEPGDYVQWNPIEFAYLHDWNVIYVQDGTDFQQIFAAQQKALNMGNDQPTAIVYRTTKGWQYGIEGRASHGAGHKLCSPEFYKAVEPMLARTGTTLPDCDMDSPRCQGGKIEDTIEACYWEALQVIRKAFETDRELTDSLAARLIASRDRLNQRNRKPRAKAPVLENIYKTSNQAESRVPAELKLDAVATTTLRAELGRVLNYYNKASDGAIFAAAADLLGSTSVNKTGDGFGEGFYNTVTNPDSRILSIGGICEDGMAGLFSGMASYGRHIGAGSSYGAFIAALGHIPARLHAIGNQARQMVSEGPYRTFFLICAHAGLKTGEDGPTHADPQPLQLLSENFPRGTMITLTPWDPQEMWPLVTAALNKRPAVIAPFVTRPNEAVLDRTALGLAPFTDAATGMYRLRTSSGKGDGTVVLQGSEVAYAFIQEALPLLEKEGIDLNVYYVASAELFDLLPEAKQQDIYPDAHADEAMGITGFTLPTMYRWIRSTRGRGNTMHAFQKGHFLGSGQAHKVMTEAGLDGLNQFKAIVRYIKEK